MNPKTFISIVAGGGLLALTAWIGSSFFTSKETEWTQSNQVAKVKQGKSYGQATLGGPFKLVDHNGIERTDADFKGKYMLVYFGYSFCPDICPTALYNLTQALDSLDKKQLDKVQPIYISIDPKRDTVRHLKTYAQNFHSKLLCLTGDEAATSAAAKSYKVYYAKAQPDGTSADYLMDHSSIVYVMDKQGRFVTSFNHATEPEQISKILKTLA